MGEKKFLPFYERIASRIPGYVVGRVVVSGLLGFAFITAHYLSIGNQVFGREPFDDWSWFLGVLIGAAMLCLYYSTHTLRTMFPEMDTRLHPGGNEVYMRALTNALSDYNFVRAGFVFGLLNCAFGYSFGLPYTKGSAIFTILGGYFLAGFVCGMAVWGIYGVSVSISAFSRKAKSSFDFTSPDHCGGTLFLGDALIVFSSVTLFVGVMISIYILKTHWTRDNTWWVMSLKSVWIVFPYASSLVALIAPAVPINKQLREYKIKQEVILQKRLSEIRKRLENEDSAAERKDLREDYGFQQNTRKELHAMRTWPFGLGANLKYLLVFATNSVVHGYLTKRGT